MIREASHSGPARELAGRIDPAGCGYPPAHAPHELETAYEDSGHSWYCQDGRKPFLCLGGADASGPRDEFGLVVESPEGWPGWWPHPTGGIYLVSASDTRYSDRVSFRVRP